MAIAERQGLFAPVRIRIGTIGLDAAIEQVHIIDGVMQTPQDPWNVGWYSQLAFPLTDQNVVLAGHRDWWGIGPVVFWDLATLVTGDRIELTSQEGGILEYRVESIDQLDAATPPAEYTATTSGEELTLVTCSGNFDGTLYDARLVVRGRLT